jgi:TPR repeat protein
MAESVNFSATIAGLALRWRAALLSLCAALLLTAAAPSSAQAGGFSAGARAYARQDYSRAAVILGPLAEHGDPWAQTYLGFMYLHGRGVPQNFEAAAHWFRLAAEQDLSAAQYYLGLMYDKGQGVEQDFVQAHAWLNLAVAHARRGERDPWTRIRDAVASKMSLAQLAEARQLALDWRPSGER